MLNADATNLATIALAEEEYSVDNGGNYTSNLENLKGTYLASVPRIPGSGGKYKVIIPPTNPKMGAYEILDDGSVGANDKPLSLIHI